ncbi:MAG: DEAD/DEAH box helicase, partial [Acidimicrobiales bacterium]
MRKGFALDAFQIEACKIVEAGRSVVVSAPTSAGKTVVAEYAIERALTSGGRTFYTTPIKALSNQKFRDLSAEFGSQRVGLLTGDASIRPDAEIVVMTTEVLRNMLYTSSRALRGLRCVVLDEVHYLMDPYRGPVWEEVMIHLEASVQMVSLSATVSNAAELADWLQEIHGPTSVVVEHRRPVPLNHEMLLKERRSKQTRMIPVLHRGKPNRRLQEMFEARRSLVAPRRVPVVRFLKNKRLLPAIYFLFSRKGCDEAARACLEAGVHLTSSHEAERIREILDQRRRLLSPQDLQALGWDAWSEMAESGIAAHHAGLVPLIKEAVEEAFGEGLIKVVFATETLAMGVNLPARTVVLEQLSRFRGDGHVPLTAADYTQLTGRAGRRGVDDQGEAVVVWSPYLQFDHLAELATTSEYPLESAFRPNYNMVVNLLARSSREEAHEVLGRSFAQFRGRKRLHKARKRLRRAQAQLEEREQACTPEVWKAVEELLLVESKSGAVLGRTHGVLADLRPGDIITGTDAGAPDVAVLSSTRRSSGYRLKVVDASGNLRTLQASDFSVVPHLIGGVAIDYPLDPNDQDSQ